MFNFPWLFNLFGEMLLLPSCALVLTLSRTDDPGRALAFIELLLSLKFLWTIWFDGILDWPGKPPGGSACFFRAPVPILEPFLFRLPIVEFVLMVLS